MFIPIGDDDRHLDGPAYVTIFLLLANLLVFGYQVANPEFTQGWSLVPAQITTGEDLTGLQRTRVEGQVVEIPHSPSPSPIFLTLFSSLFMHAGLLHLGGNMLYLWIFGDNVEHRFGSLAFLVLYLASGLAGSLAHILLSPDSIIPSLGASGAISGVLGAYLILFPRNRVHAVFFFYIISLPAIVVIGFWIAFQLFFGLGQIFGGEQAAGVAYGAHLGGFFAGILLAVIMRIMIKVERPNVLTRAEHADSRRVW
jgi:membrane associated rhomboid family serine protease